jgi:uncharacterized protein YkwD
MKTKLTLGLLLGIWVCTLISCTSDSVTSTANETPLAVVDYSYSSSEIEAMKLINNYRVSVGLNALEKRNHISYKSEEHDNYMITNNVISHDNFVARSENIMKVLGASTVGENVASGYSTAQAALDAWIASPAHKKNIEGNFTHFGIAIRENPVNGKKYYTNIFVKI